jgi:spermidine synthase
MTERWGPLPIVGVEHDAAVAWLARKEFGLDALPNVEVCVADAFSYMRRCERRFAAICVDLYIAGHMTHGVLASSFLRDIAHVLASGGSVSFNLWRSAALADQTRRLARHLHVLSQTTVDDNVVVRCVHRHRPLLPGEV